MICNLLLHLKFLLLLRLLGLHELTDYNIQYIKMYDSNLLEIRDF